MNTFYFIFVVVFFQIILSPSHAQVDPAIDWKVQEDDRAVWIYDSRHRTLVEQYAKNFRRLLPEIQKLFHELPEKTTFVISDFTDRPNGSATVFPYPMIVIYPVIPLPNSPIGETDDSLYEILAHEYTHILNLHPVHGGMRALSWIFGSIVRPNGYLPRWYTEGLAVFTESYFTPRGGRLRSQNFEGMVRAIQKGQTWEKYPIDTINDFEPDWLGGRRAYLLGGALMYELATTHGLDKIDSLNQSYSRRLPYFINGPVERRTQNDYSQLLDDAYEKLKNSAAEQIKTISAATTTKGTSLEQQGFFNSRPVFSPDGKYLAFISRDHNVPSSIQLRKRDSENTFLKSEPLQIAFGVDISDLAWSPDSSKIVYNSVETHRRFYEYSDLRMYDVKTQKTTKLTSGARAGDLTFSPQGDFIYFVQNTPGSKRLAQLDLGKKMISSVYTPSRPATNLYSLVIENDQLFFLEQHSEKRALKAYHLKTKTLTTVSENIATSSLRKTAKGFLITSSQSGVDNLYLVPSLREPANVTLTRPVTNSLTRILDGDIDPSDSSLYYSEHTENGHFIFSQKESEWTQINQAPKVTPLLAVPQIENSMNSQNENVTFAKKEKNFSPWPYLWPRYWMPFGNVIDGGVSFQASTGASDPLGKNAYGLMLEWDTLTQKTGVSGSYVNTSTPVELGLAASQVYRYNYTLDSALRDTSGSVSAGYDLPFMFRNWTLGLSWRWGETEFVNSIYRRSGPSAILGFNNAVQRGYEISPESGMSTSLSHQSFIEDLGNIGYNKTNLNFKTYFSRWLPQHNVLYLGLNGTYAPELELKGRSPDITGFYTSTLNGNFFNNLLIPPFLVRGYTSGSILGYNMLAANLEYRFPIARVFRGWDTIPFFVKRLHGALVSDAVSLDGYRRSDRFPNSLISERFGDNWFMGYGAELNMECTLGYYLPVTFSFGIYQGANADLAAEDISYFFNFKF